MLMEQQSVAVFLFSPIVAVAMCKERLRVSDYVDKLLNYKRIDVQSQNKICSWPVMSF